MRGIRKKLFITYLIITGIIFLLFYLSQVVFIGKIYTYYKINQLKNYSLKIANALAKNDDKTANELMEESNSKVIVVTDTGNLIFGTHGNGQGYGIGLPKTYLNTDEKLSVVEFTHPSIGVKSLAVIRAFLYNKQNAKLVLTIPLSTITDTTVIFKSEFLLMLLICIVVIIIMSIVMSKKLTKPIDDLKYAAQNIASGNLDVKLDVNTNDELEDLAMSMNSMAENLSKAEKFKRDLIANITHDLKTPLGLIKGYCEMLLDFYGEDKEKRNKYLNAALNEVDRMSKMIDDVLSLSKFQSGLVKLKISSFNLKSLVDDVVLSFEPLLHGKNINIVMENLDVIVNGDAELIRRVIMNLLSNSIKSISKSGLITISAILENNHVKVIVSDTGKGIKREELPNVFKKFYKGDKSGIGLGLAIVKEILDLHGSEYYIESEINKGTLFYFTLNKADI
ncbi:integral membrane sensor signal transduction histidine kinase [Thermoanaerobacterium thermosaccharolyticum DSM 571]|uniref:histidine kinase n=1 Tax=Thermoanaerobacterium thermosaccharolyticum (strain ATCC 7956 / DSM 571 / NCIMB 9385 / NCA 3814 / NCTC 13789 / WDCM 00135 / 2032) TaxID=580327 RepID=D9TTW7_THETC|nr:HAMP domain-containing sensor histidine kinase [Thermoanaerobacterium thermosaccharolyticum]ADL69443.1 integral membrane sensor signal transduction histidine kinase [Thermoanaerobacterium thermosaccharolyticum DSM 571]